MKEYSGHVLPGSTSSWIVVDPEQLQHLLVRSDLRVKHNLHCFCVITTEGEMIAKSIILYLVIILTCPATNDPVFFLTIPIQYCLDLGPSPALCYKYCVHLKSANPLDRYTHLLTISSLEDTYLFAPPPPFFSPGHVQQYQVTGCAVNQYKTSVVRLTPIITPV